MTSKYNLTVERLREVLDYSTETGEFRWKVRGKGIRCGAVAGRRPARGVKYIQIKIDQVSYSAHRLAWFYVTGVWPTDEIDHVDCDGFNNRFYNLRDCSRPQNNGNRRQLLAKKYSSLKGVSFSKKTGKWVAGIKIDGKNIHLGCFDSDVLAHSAYLEAANRYFGEFARAA